MRGAVAVKMNTSNHHTHLLTNRLLFLKLSELFWFFAINLLLFEMPLQNLTGFTLIDELVTILFLTSALVKLANRKNQDVELNAFGARALECVGLLLLFGFASNAVSCICLDIKPIAIDTFACVKFPLALLSSVVVFERSQSILQLFELEAKFLLVVMAIFGTLNLFVEIDGFGVDPRYGLRASFQFFFGHPENLNLAIVGLVIALSPRYEQNTRWIVLALAVMCLTLRSKAFAFVGVAVFLLVTWRNSKELKLYHVVVGLGAVFLIGYDQFNYYFSLDGAARSELTRVGILVANRFFPLGSGFATYASNITSDPSYYSPLYYQYGLYTVEGLKPGNIAFLSDTFWPIVIGQFGWLGAICFCLILVLLFLFAYKVASSAGQRLACILGFSYLLIESTAASAFFHPCSVYLAICLGLIVCAPGDKEGI